jgi:methionine-rich copper-binding protein CopC
MRRSLLVIAAAGLLGAAAFHLTLKESFPGKDETLVTAPDKVSLTFSAKVNVKLSAISILAADSTEIAKLAVTAGPKPTMLEAVVPRRLAGGRYIIRWRTAGADGHAMRGAFGFAINSAE